MMLVAEITKLMFGLKLGAPVDAIAGRQNWLFIFAVQ